MERKPVILVVSFGTSYPETRKKTIEAIEREIEGLFPEYEIRRAFTSQMIINKLAKRDGEKIDNVAEAMKRLVDDGVKRVIVQPTHIMNGSEYDDMVADVNACSELFESLQIGKPLLTAMADYRAVVDVMKKEMNLVLSEEGTALVYMGHGTEHYANATYACLDYCFKHMGASNAFVGTVEGYPELPEVLGDVRASGAKKVVLAPLMVVAGDHAINDMAGDEEDSWKTVFEGEGYVTETILKGLGEYEAIRELYAAHVRAVILQE